MAKRTELQNFLKKCIEDVRTDLFHRNKRKGGHQPPQRPGVDPRAIPPEQFSPADRITVMEWLISQDHVIYMLYDKMFPRHEAGRGAVAAPVMSMDGMGTMGSVGTMGEGDLEFRAYTGGDTPSRTGTAASDASRQNFAQTL